MLTVTNDVGCWEEETGEIEIYEVVSDFTISDTLLHCSPQDVTLTSLNNENIDSWNWTIDEQEHSETIPDTDPTYIHAFEDKGYSDLTLIIDSDHGCSDTLTRTEAVFLNGYEAEIAAVPAAICFDGSASVTQAFSASITADVSDLPYDVISYSWDILSDNSASAIKTDIDSLNVSYEFTASGEYTLEYLAVIDGTNSDCEYRDTIVFNVGVDTEIDFDNLICVGGEFEASSVVDDWSSSHTYLWSSESELIFGTETESSTTIISTTPLGAGVSEIYDIMLTVTNDVGCWEEETGEIEVYEVVSDFTISDTLLHCSPQDVTLTSLNNENIDSWDWTIDEQEHSETISDTDPTYIHSFEDQGYSDLTLIIGSVHGCSDTLIRTDAVFLNGYEAEIALAPDSICFDAETVTQAFSATINANVSDLPYDVTSYSWDILSDNSASAIKTDIDSLNVSYEFTASGEYTLEYLAVIDGTNSDCEYRDTIVFNVGVDTEIDFDNLICVGGEFSASSVVDDWSSSHSYLWSSESELIIGTETESSTTISSVYTIRSRGK